MLSGALARNAGTGYTESQSAGQADGVSHVASQSHTDGQAHSHTEGLAVSDGISNTHTAGSSVTESHSVSDGQSAGSNASQSQGEGWNVGGSVGVPGVASVNGGYNSSSSESQGSFASTSNTVTDGTAVTQSVSDSLTQSHSETQSQSDTNTTSQADTVGQADGVSHTDSQSTGQALARGLSQGFSQGIAFGVAPSFSVGESNQWQFDPAILLTNILRKQQEILNTITLEGGFYTDVYALAGTERGRQALLTLIPEAFHGVEDVVMGVQTRTLTPEEDAYLRLHAKAMVPSTREIHIPEAMTAYADSTLLTMLQAAAYMAPGLFEEGLARTVQEAIPPFAFDPYMPGEVALARQYSTERGEPDPVHPAPDAGTPLPHRLRGRHRLRQVGGRRTPGLRDHPALALPHDRAGLWPGLAQGPALAGAGRPGGHPPAASRRGAPDPLEPAADPEAHRPRPLPQPGV